MDVHPPHEPIHSWRDFFLHLVTITIGLFIALMLEAGVEAIHHKHLVREADANLRSEIRDNQTELRSALAEIEKEQEQARADMAVLRQYVSGHKPKTATLTAHFVSANLNRGSWETAKDTGATGFMRYADVKRYDDIYTLQENLEAAQLRSLDAETPFLAVFMSLDKGEGPEDLSQQQLQDSIKAVGQIAARLLVTQAVAKELDKQYSAALAAKQP